MLTKLYNDAEYKDLLERMHVSLNQLLEKV